MMLAKILISFMLLVASASAYCSWGHGCRSCGQSCIDDYDAHYYCCYEDKCCCYRHRENCDDTADCPSNDCGGNHVNGTAPKNTPCFVGESFPTGGSLDEGVPVGLAIGPPGEDEIQV